MKKLVHLLLLLVTFASSQAQNQSPIPTTLMRRGKIMFVSQPAQVLTQADSLGAVLKKLVVGDSVNILEISVQDYEQGGKKDKWYKAKNGEIVGWVFGSFLSVDRIIKPMIANRPTKRIPADSTVVIRNYGYLVTCKNNLGQIELKNNIFPDSMSVYTKYEFQEYFPELNICIFQIQYENSTKYLVILLDSNTKIELRGYPIISFNRQKACVINVEDNRSSESIIDVYNIEKDKWTFEFSQKVNGIVPEYQWLNDKTVKLKAMLTVPKKEKSHVWYELDVETRKIKEELKEKK